MDTNKEKERERQKEPIVRVRGEGSYKGIKSKVQGRAQKKRAGHLGPRDGEGVWADSKH